MNKTLIALAIASTMAAGSAFATGWGHHGGGSGGGSPAPQPTTVSATVSATSVTSTYAAAGNGGTSHSTAGNFASGSGAAQAVTAPGSVTVTGNCITPGTVTGQVTTVTGSATTTGGSYATNTSTGNGTGSAFAGGFSQANVELTKNGVGGGAQSNTATMANAGTNEARTSYATQSASFEAKGVTSSTGAATTGTSSVTAATQKYSLSNGQCGNNGCTNGTDVVNFTTWTGTGSDTLGQAWTNATVTNASSN